METNRCKIKICGLRRPEDIAYVNRAKPDYIGFVFAKSTRQVSMEEAAALKARLDPSIPAVGVFVDADIRQVAEAADAGIIDYVQLHGSEDEACIEAVKRATRLPVIKAFGIRDASDIAAAACSGADYVLLDHGHGGTGKTFEWKLAKRLSRPYFLAGGLDADNVGEALAALHPFAVDVSSGVETDGVKDEDKIRSVLNAIRGNGCNS